MSLIPWDTAYPPTQCEGLLLNKFVPGFDEFFSGVAGIFVIIIALTGFLQPRLDVTIKIMYSGLIISGVGTTMFHWNRLYAYRFIEDYPLFITLAFALAAFFDDAVFEFRRYRAARAAVVQYTALGRGGPAAPIPSLAERKREMTAEMFRGFIISLFNVVVLAYLIAGVIAYIFFTEEYIFALYFGAPFAFFAFVGMFYIVYRHRQVRLPHTATLFALAVSALAAGVVSFCFKLIDSVGCTPLTVWFFPYPIFRIFLAYCIHLAIVFLSFNRANNFLLFGEPIPRVSWNLGFFPMVSTPALRSGGYMEPSGFPEMEQMGPNEGAGAHFPFPNFPPQANGGGYPAVSMEDLSRGSGRY